MAAIATQQLEAENDLEFVLNERQRQTSARFLYRLSLDPSRCRRLLAADHGETTSESDLKELQTLFAAVALRARLFKVANSLLFWATLLAMFAGSFWAIADLLWFDVQDQLLSSAIEEFLMVGAGGFLFFLYRLCKRRQSAIEDVMRLVLFGNESHERKLRVLRGRRELAAPSGPSTVVRRPAEEVWNEAARSCRQPGWLEDRVGKPLSAADLLKVLAQLKDARIKAYSYRFLSHIFMFAFVACLVAGVAVALVAARFPGLDPTAVGTIQSALTLGAGGLCWSTNRQYVRKKRQLEEAMSLTLAGAEPLRAKCERLARTLRSVDTGFEKGEGGAK